MKNTKENLISEYIKLKGHLGKQPSYTEFLSQTGISKLQIQKFFGSEGFSKLVIECGDIPNKFRTQKSDLKGILIQWGQLARQKGKLPAGSDWRFNDYKPTVEGIKASHDLNWTDIPNKFLEFYIDNDEWRDVVALIPKKDSQIITSIPKPIPKIEGLTFEYLKFIPPAVQDLIELSSSEENSNEFEKSVNLIFQMLGFEVIDYGQGTGRNPDGVAKENQHRYAILIDSKSRKENYRMGTEDRKFIEYIRTFSEPLRKDGFKNIYFLVVSSRFDTVSTVAIKNIKVETQVTTTLLTSRLLLKLLSTKIQTPRRFDLKKFQELLIEDGEITENKIDKFIGGLKF